MIVNASKIDIRKTFHLIVKATYIRNYCSLDNSVLASSASAPCVALPPASMELCITLAPPSLESCTLRYSAIIDTRSNRFNTHKRFFSCTCLRRLRTNRHNDRKNTQLHTHVFFINTPFDQLLIDAYRGTCGYGFLLFPQPSS